MQTIGDRIELAARNKGMSLSAVAKAVGKSRAAAHRWRQGGGIHPETLKAIAELLDVSERWLLTGKENPADKEEGAGLMALYRQLRKETEQLPQPVKKVVVKLFMEAVMSDKEEMEMIETLEKLLK